MLNAERIFVIFSNLNPFTTAQSINILRKSDNLKDYFSS